MALHATGGLVVGGRDIAFVDFTDAPPRPLLTSDDVPGSMGFNDLTTDRTGRVYVGSLAYRVFGGDPPKPGHLHVIDVDGGMRTISDGVMLTMNGSVAFGMKPRRKRSTAPSGPYLLAFSRTTRSV
jgi:gluconolactonase